MDKEVFRAIINNDEAKALEGVELFNLVGDFMASNHGKLGGRAMTQKEKKNNNLGGRAMPHGIRHLGDWLLHIVPSLNSS